MENLCQLGFEALSKKVLKLTNLPTHHPSASIIHNR